MRVKVTTAFPGRPDHEPLSRQIAVGEVVDGELAAVALQEKWGEEEVLEAPQTEAPQTENHNLDDMTVAQLRAFAAEKAIDLGAAELKAEIRAVIDAALSA
jgi:hypothetical protein